MRLFKYASALALLASLTLINSVRADDQAQSKEIKGVLIDTHCGEKMMKESDPQAAAEKHPKDCCVKCGNDSGTFAIISDGKMTPLDDKSNTMAKDYINKDDSKTDVVVQGSVVDGKLSITSIKAAE